MTLRTTRDSGLPVGFFVREGVAEIEGNTLKFTSIPPHAGFPAKVTGGAYQFDRTSKPKL